MSFTGFNPSKQRMKRAKERVITSLLFLAAASSILITAGIVGILIYESSAFFAHVSLKDFLTDTQWTPLFEDAHYDRLRGHTLEGLARLFADNVRLYAYPMTVRDLDARFRAISAAGWERSEVGGWVTADNLRPMPPLSHIYAYLIATGFIVPMQPPAS